MNTSPLLPMLLREPWMVDPMYALSSGATVMQLLDPDQRKFTPRGKVGLQLLDSSGVLAWQDEDEDDSGQQTPQSIPDGSIAIIPLHNEMLKYGTWCSYGAVDIAAMLKSYLDHPNIAGILLDIDTPGGAVNSIPPYVEVLQGRTKPVLALSDLCCSAGMYVSLYTDHHMASNNISSRFGSIGVMLSFADMKPLWEKQGIVFHTIKPPESSDKNLALELALEGKYEMIIEEMLSPMAKRFQNDVREARKGKLKEQPGVLNGKTFFAEEALQYGLIDSVGNKQKAIEKLRELIDIDQFIKSNQ